MEGYRLFTDALGRQVWVPDTVRRIIPVNESTMRMLCYAKGADRVCGIEDVEMRSTAFTHIFANPDLKKQPQIGPMFGGDPELIMMQNPELLLTSNMTIGDADELSDKLQLPVVVIEYGNLGDQCELFLENLQLLGELLGTEEQTDSLINYICYEIEDLWQRSGRGTKKQAYLGGISYRGRHDIVSTDPGYAAFRLVQVPNAAASLMRESLAGFENTTIDMEVLLTWNPDYLFVDQGGYKLVKDNFRTNQALSKVLKSYKNNNIYLLWPFYMFHSNFEAMLINAWSVGKVIYPDAFEDVDLRDKANEILVQFVGADVSDSLIAEWGWYRNITDEL